MVTFIEDYLGSNDRQTLSTGKGKRNGRRVRGRRRGKDEEGKRKMGGEEGEARESSKKEELG